METQFVKKSVKQVKAPADKTGWELVGHFEGIHTKEYTDIDDKGEVVERTFRSLILKAPDGSLEAYGCDAGLAQQIELAGIQKGDLIKCVNLGKEKLSGARTMNVWDVFVASN